jgi:hypothetical protein
MDQVLLWEHKTPFSHLRNFPPVMQPPMFIALLTTEHRIPFRSFRKPIQILPSYLFSTLLWCTVWFRAVERDYRHPRHCSHYSDHAMDWMVRGSNIIRIERYLFSSEMSKQALGTTELVIQLASVFFPRVKKAEASCWPPPNADVKNYRNRTYSPPI